jgi:hypothetical protein
MVAARFGFSPSVTMTTSDESWTLRHNLRISFADRTGHVEHPHVAAFPVHHGLMKDGMRPTIQSGRSEY